jgi:hypothetical protein
VLTGALQQRKAEGPQVFAALDSLSKDLTQRVASYGSLSKVPAEATSNVRNDMYLVLDTTKLATKKPEGFQPDELKALKDYQTSLEAGTRFIPLWVKIVVALALGLGTMIGWKRIVITVGEKIGKQHMTYGMGASAELVAAARSWRPTLRPAGVDHAHPVFGRGRRLGRQRIGAAGAHGAQPAAGLAADAARGDAALGRALLADADRGEGVRAAAEAAAKASGARETFSTGCAANSIRPKGAPRASGCAVRAKIGLHMIHRIVEGDEQHPRASANIGRTLSAVPWVRAWPTP